MVSTRLAKERSRWTSGKAPYHWVHKGLVAISQVRRQPPWWLVDGPRGPFPVWEV